MRLSLRLFLTFAPLVQMSASQGAVPRIISERPIEPGRWSLVLERTIQPPEGDSSEVIEAFDLAIADDGSIAVVEPRPAHVKLFGPNGAFVRRLGREGSGPGEFRSGYVAMRGDTLVVQDPRAGRAVLLNWRSGALIRELYTARNHFHPIGIDSRGRAVVWTIAARRDTTTLQNQGFVRFALAAASPETLWVTERRLRTESKSWLVRDANVVRMGVAIPLQPQALYAVDPLGTFVTGWSGEYLLRTTRNGRDTAMLFGRSYTPVPVTSAEKVALVARAISSIRAGNSDAPPEAVLRAAFDVSLIPDKRPAFESVHVDGSGRRWVRLSSGDTTIVTFDLFDNAGRWLDIVRIAARSWPRATWSSVAFNKTHAAVSVEGDDGRPMIRVYRIVRR